MDEDKPWFNWYVWRNDKWGVKWNVCKGSMDERENEVSLWFETPWLPPYPVFVELAKLHPELEFEFDWIEEQGVYGPKRHMSASDGFITDEEWYEDDSKEAYEHMFERWGNRESYAWNPKKNTYECLE